MLALAVFEASWVEAIFWLIVVELNRRGLDD